MLAAQQRAIDAHPDKEFYNLNIDAGAMWARRLIDRMMAAEDPTTRRYARLRGGGRAATDGTDDARRGHRGRRRAAGRGAGVGRWPAGPLRAGAGPRRPRRRRRRAPDRDRARGRRRAVPDRAATSTSPCEIDGLPDIRSYSLVGERPGRRRVPDRRQGGCRTAAAARCSCAALEPGADVEVSEPRSHFELQHGRPEYLLVAGGIGITPLVGMAHALERHGRPFRLLYAARDAASRCRSWTSCEELLGDRARAVRRPPRASGSTSTPRSSACTPTASSTCAGRCGCATRPGARGGERRAAPRPAAFETFASGGRFPPEAFTVRVRDHDGASRGRREPHAARRAQGRRRRDDVGLPARRVRAVRGRRCSRPRASSTTATSSSARSSSRRATRSCTCVSRAVGGASRSTRASAPTVGRGRGAAGRDALSESTNVNCGWVGGESEPPRGDECHLESAYRP